MRGTSDSGRHEQGIASISTRPIPVHRTCAEAGPCYLGQARGFVWGRRATEPAEVDADTARGYANEALARRPLSVSRLAEPPIYAPQDIPEITEDEGCGALLLGEGATAYLGLPVPAERLAPEWHGDLAIRYDPRLIDQLGLDLAPAGIVPYDRELWSRYRWIEHRVYRLTPRPSLAIGLRDPARQARLGSLTRLRLDVYLANVGESVVFSDEPIAHASSFEGALEDLLALVPIDGPGFAAFFERYGAPPGIGAVDPYWSRGRRFIPLSSMRALRLALDEAARGRRSPTGWWQQAMRWWARDEASAIAPERLPHRFGQVEVGPDGLPELALDLWEQIALQLGTWLRDGGIGFCEAPLPYSEERCGRAFLVRRRGMRKYCSTGCHDRANARRRVERGRARPSG